jgi:hypothetical protein
MFFIGWEGNETSLAAKVAKPRKWASAHHHHCFGVVAAHHSVGSKSESPKTTKSKEDGPLYSS